MYRREAVRPALLAPDRASVRREEAESGVLNAREVKDALRRRHPAYDAGLQGPGQWTCIEEWHNIDLLAFNAWSSGGPKYGRVGYEVKVSRADYRRELLNPGKRSGAVAFCHEFYFAVPAGLLKEDEIAYKPPDALADFDAYQRERCPGFYGERCLPSGQRGTGTYEVTFGRQTRHNYRWGYRVTCPTCEGKGYILPSLAERIAPYLWVPADVGLIEVTASGTRATRKAPRRKVEGLSSLGVSAQLDRFTDATIAGLVRHASFRPDPRHTGRAA